MPEAMSLAHLHHGNASDSEMICRSGGGMKLRQARQYYSGGEQFSVWRSIMFAGRAIINRCVNRGGGSCVQMLAIDSRNERCIAASASYQENSVLNMAANLS